MQIERKGVRSVRYRQRERKNDAVRDTYRETERECVCVTDIDRDRQ